MNFIGKWFRLFQIAYIWVKYGLDEIVFSTPLLKAFRFIVYLNPLNWCQRKKLSEGERLRLAFEHLGPIFVKFGQILSTRRDFLPDHVATALAKLQDQVKPFASEKAVKIVEKSLGESVQTVFASFDTQPLASASIAQVHSAKLKTGEDVVVKVLRPDIDKIIKRDIALMYLIAKICDRAIKSTRRLRPVEIVKEIERTVIHELDLMREGANAAQIKRNSEKCSYLYIPEIYWDYCRQDVMVMEKISGTSINNIAQLKSNNVDLKLLAERLFEVFYTQAFDDCFFHADLHPGNVFVSDENPHDPTIIAVDFGIIGTLNKEDQRYLAGNFLAFFKRDYRKVAELHIESGWVPATQSVEELESALRTVCEPIFQKPLQDISLGQTLMRLIQIAQDFDMVIQPQLLLLQKTILNIEGIGRDLYPGLDLWATAKPYLEKWMKRQVGMRGFVSRLKKEIPNLSYHLPEMPEMLISLVKAQKARHRMELDQAGQANFERKQRRWWRSGLLALGGGLLVYGGLTWFAKHHWLDWQQFLNMHATAIGVLGVVVILLALTRS